MEDKEKVTMADVFKLSLEQYEQKRKKDTSVEEKREEKRKED